MRNYGKKKNYCLIAALASLVAFFDYGCKRYEWLRRKFG